LRHCVIVVLLLVVTGVTSPAAATEAATGWRQQASRTQIIRDDWGIAHVRGKTDADAIFGMVYAQAEDDFNRVETNYVNAMGRLAEAEGEREIWRDLRMKLFIDPDSMKAKFAASPAWLKTVSTAWADGLNFYLSTHPQVKPRVIAHFEPWMALTFSEGSIGGDIEGVSLRDLEAFYGRQGAAGAASSGKGPNDASGDAYDFAESGADLEPRGSNGIAVGPGNTVNHRALLFINPHTSFFFRSELQVHSDEGLNAYGAVTWGQFFIYQGFNDRVGWMHTTSGVDAVDEYAETVAQRGGKWTYRYGSADRPVTVQTIRVPYKTASGMATRTFTVYRTSHGPVVREADGKWIAVRLMQKPVEALSESYLRTKARDLASFRDVMKLQANSSNNTIYADADGNIAYFHPQFIPKRADRFDWTKPVDGSDPATEWTGQHGVDDSPHLLNPATGWLYNSNDAPWMAAGPASPKQAAFPKYMDKAGMNARGPHAIRVLENKRDFTPQRLIDAAFDSYLPAFAQMVPPLLAAYDALPAADPQKARLADQIAALRGWDFRWSAASVPTSLAVYWGEALGRRVSATGVVTAPPAELLQALATASDKLAADFGKWQTPWGDINRFQRLTGDIVQPFSDAGPSIPVAFTSARWGSLASFGARQYPGTKKWYGTSGNSFVAVVEFGKDSVRARAVTAGGESGDPKSKHFDDQATRYATGGLREVYFYLSQLQGHTERQYHPGQ
ncbi:MAG: penicillin acylase family protein, partial [Gemmatirosa sp.]|nr:penicillin acylase family protein [Gemmatirosa sp.]